MKLGLPLSPKNKRLLSILLAVAGAGIVLWSLWHHIAAGARSLAVGPLQATQAGGILGVVGPFQQLVMLLGLASLIGGIALLVGEIRRGDSRWGMRVKHIARHPATTGLGLLLLLAGNFFLRWVLEEADLYLYNYFTLAMPSFKWWQFFVETGPKGFFIPATGITVLAISVTSPAIVWCLYHMLLILVSFFVSWRVFHSRVFSFTLAFCLGYGTQFYHTYIIPAILDLPFVLCLFIINMWLTYEFLRAYRRKWLWGGLCILSIVVLPGLGVEWLDYLVFLWFASVYVLAFLWLRGDRERLHRQALILGLTTVVGILHIVVTTRLHSATYTPGLEEDVIFNYPNWLPAVEDTVSNLIQFVYMALTNFLPPAFLSSSALAVIGAKELVEYQAGYHAAYSHLIPMHYMFLWRYLAGALFGLFMLALVKVTARSLRTLAFGNAILVVFMIMVLLGSPTHLIIKARPMKSMPYLTYYIDVAILGMSLLIAYLLMLARTRMRNVMLAVFIIVFSWAVIGYSALVRPGYLYQMALSVGIAYQRPGPDPLRSMAYLIKSVPFIQTLTDSFPGPGVQPPSVSLPDLDSWAMPEGVRLSFHREVRIVEVDRAREGFRLTSPEVAVASHRKVTLRFNGRVIPGKVCIGVTGHDEEQWLAPPQDLLKPVVFDSGDNQAFRAVLLDCYPKDKERVDTRIIFYSLSYKVAPQ
jgi:hypothetical protein